MNDWSSLSFETFEQYIAGLWNRRPWLGGEIEARGFVADDIYFRTISNPQSQLSIELANAFRNYVSVRFFDQTPVAERIQKSDPPSLEDMDDASDWEAIAQMALVTMFVKYELDSMTFGPIEELNARWHQLEESTGLDRRQIIDISSRLGK